MTKVKYYYDSETLSYQKITLRKRDKFKKGVILFLGFILSGILGYVVLSQFFETPNEKKLKTENQNLLLNYKLLDKKLLNHEAILSELEDRDNNIYRTYFEVNPISTEQRKAGFGGINRYKHLENFENSEMIIDATKNMDILSKQIVIQSKSLDEIEKLANNKEQMLAAIPAIQPVKKENLKRMASGFGWREDPFTKARKKHKGMDFTAPRGTPIYATGNGRVTRADNKSAGYGKHIRIDHGYGYTTLYAHLSRYNVRKGQKIKRGDLIGFVGNTGRSQAPHLHYEVHKNGKAINPINFYYGNLSPEEFEAMQKAAKLEGQSLD